MTYECAGCGKTGGGDVYPRMVLNLRSEVLCGSCKERLQSYLEDKWRDWFRIQFHKPQEKRVSE